MQQKTGSFSFKSDIFRLEDIKMFVKQIDFQVVYKHMQGGLMPTDAYVLTEIQKEKDHSVWFPSWECFLWLVCSIIPAHLSGHRALLAPSAQI